MISHSNQFLWGGRLKSDLATKAKKRKERANKKSSRPLWLVGDFVRLSELEFFSAYSLPAAATNLLSHSAHFNLAFLFSLIAFCLCFWLGELSLMALVAAVASETV